VFTSMLEVMTTKSDMLRLIEQRGALKDSELPVFWASRISRSTRQLAAWPLPERSVASEGRTASSAII
jgi:hypothetical protein